METKQLLSCFKGVSMQNTTAIENGLRECFQSFMAKGVGPIECSCCPTYKLCSSWERGEHERLLFIGQDIVDAETGEIICQII